MSWHKSTLKVNDLLALLGQRCPGTCHLMFNSNDDLVEVFIFRKGAKDGYKQKNFRPPVTVTTRRKKAVKGELSPEEDEEDEDIHKE